MTPLDCETCLLRQFDSDCAADKPTPADVSAHLASCDNCRQEWQLARRFDATLRAELMVDVPTELYRRAYHAAIIAPQNESPPMRQSFRLLFAGLVGVGCAMVSLVAPYTSEMIWLAPVAFFAGAVMTYLVEFFDEEKTPAL